MKRLLTFLSLALLTGVIFSACTLLQEEVTTEPTTPVTPKNTETVPMSVEILPSAVPAQLDVSIPISFKVN